MKEGPFIQGDYDLVVEKELHPTFIQNEIRAINVLRVEETIQWERTGCWRGGEHLSWALQNNWILQEGKGESKQVIWGWKFTHGDRNSTECRKWQWERGWKGGLRPGSRESCWGFSGVHFKGDTHVSLLCPSTCDVADSFLPIPLFQKCL